MQRQQPSSTPPRLPVIRDPGAAGPQRARPGRQQQQAGISFSLARRPLWLPRGADRARSDFRIGHGEDFAAPPRYSDDL